MHNYAIFSYLEILVLIFCLEAKPCHEATKPTYISVSVCCVDARSMAVNDT